MSGQDTFFTEEEVAIHNVDFNVLAESLEDGKLRDRFPCDNCREYEREKGPLPEKVKYIIYFFHVNYHISFYQDTYVLTLNKVRWL